MSRANLKSLFQLLLIVVLFYWKILLTNQFSPITGYEGVNQAYSWYHFWTNCIRQGTLPLWDPYTFSGRSFVGEMQTGAFYPLNLLLLLVPFGENGLFSPQLYNYFFAFGHLLGALFMFALARELGLSRFSALIAGISFSFGGFVAMVSGWPHMLQSAIWLPAIFLFLLRAIHAAEFRRLAVYASLSGLCLGVSILAGGLHVVIMQGILAVSAVAYAFFARIGGLGSAGTRQRAIRASAVLLIFTGIGCGIGAIQLLPSIEYSRLSMRFLGSELVSALPPGEKIPYAVLQDGAWPHHFVTFLIPQAYNGISSSGEYPQAYLGVFPLLLAVAGIWRCWPKRVERAGQADWEVGVAQGPDLREPAQSPSNTWVRYLAWLSLIACLYSLASYSFLHGLAYVFVPYLWMAREAGRFYYLTNFALPLLAGFGAEALFFRLANANSWLPAIRILKWVMIACALALAAPAVFGTPNLYGWVSFSILLILLSASMFVYIARGHTGRPVRFLLIGLILLDLNAFDWSIRNKHQVAANDINFLEEILSGQKVAAFLKSQPGLFRVSVDVDPRLNFGNVYGLQTTLGAAVTLVEDYTSIMGNHDLLNVRYHLKPASTPDPGFIYQDAAWKVYENPRAFPRAWLVRETEVYTSSRSLQKRLEEKDFDAQRIALLDAPLDEPGPEPGGTGVPGEVFFESYKADRMVLRTRADARALLVLSENHYPGWQAHVNGRPARIYKVYGALRGIIVPPGESQVSLDYTPGSIVAGACITGATLLIVLFLLAADIWRCKLPGNVRKTAEII